MEEISVEKILCLKGKILLCLFIFTHSDISDIKCLNICMDIYSLKKIPFWE